MTAHSTDAVALIALDIVQHAVGELLDRSLSHLPHQAQACTHMIRRQELLDAELQLGRQRHTLPAMVCRAMKEQFDKWSRPSGHTPLTDNRQPDWSSLSLVEDATVERTVAADRLAQHISSRAEPWLSPLHAQLSALLQPTGDEEVAPHPLRPQVLSKALLEALAEQGVSELVIRTLLEQWATLAPEVLAPCYERLVTELRKRGLQPAQPSVRRKPAASATSGHMGLNPQSGTAPLPGAPTDFQRTATGQGTWSGPSTGTRVAQVLSDMFGVPPPWGTTGQTGTNSTHGGPAWATTAAAQEAASNADFQDLLKRIAMQEQAPPPDLGAASGVNTWPSQADAASAPGFSGPLMAPNVIRAHRDELIQARGGAPLDQMIIDIVAALFDQVLSDPKVAPQMARQIARLQMPVLRVALSDTRFFSSRRHPVRRFVNRIANLSAVFDDLESGAGLECVQRVTALVNEVVEGDFERMDLYELKLTELESLIDRLQSADAEGLGDVQTLLAGREADLRVHQRYMQILHKELADVALPAFVREFLTQIWSQVQVMAAARDGAQSPLALRMKDAGRELVFSVQPKGVPQLRKAFLLKLPKLMKDLSEGLALIQWPEEAKQAFFAQLLPAHAECLKAPPAHDLTQRMLEHRLSQVEQINIPSREEAANDPLPQALDDPQAPPLPGVMTAFTAVEVAQAGLVSDAALQAETAVDIPLDESTPHDPSLAELDIDLDCPPPPSQGLALVHHIQKGTAYQMMMQGQWKKVRLTWVSEGRSFFIFTHGGMHKKTISLTARTLAKMCDSGRFKAFEQSELLERATVRARRQLAALQTGHKARDAA